MSITVTPVAVSAVTQAVQGLLKANPDFAEVDITRSEEINEDPAMCPWVGIYRNACNYPIRTLGMGSGFRKQEINMVIIAQEADAVSGAACEDRLNELVDDITKALLNDTTLGGVVETIDSFEVRFPDYRVVNDEKYLQSAMIFFTALTNVIVGG